MRVQFIDDVSKRSDGRSGKPTQITLFKEYEVVEVLKEQYAVINDENKLARYTKSRFVVSDNKGVEDISKAFNSLTHPMRMELKRLRKLVEEQVKYNKRVEMKLNNHVIEMKGSTLGDRIRLKRVLEDNNQPVYVSRCNINGVMLDGLFEIESDLVWTKLAYTNNMWQNVNETFKATITFEEFIEEFKTL